jgi:hypothetical protein
MLWPINAFLLVNCYVVAMASSSQVPTSQASGAVVAAGTEGEGDDVVVVSDGEEGQGQDGRKRKLRLAVWKDFGLADDDGVSKAKCNHCGRKLSAISRNGTTHLKTHLKSYPYYNKKPGDKIQTNLRFGTTELEKLFIQ